MAKAPMTRSLLALTIASSGTATRAVNVMDECEDALVLGIQSPATLDAGTYVLQVSHNGTTWAALQAGDPLADIAVPGAGKATTNDVIPAFKYFRITGPTAAADRTFIVTKQGLR